MELRLEVLHAAGLKGAEYRFGDLSCSLLGINDLRPYVEVTFQSQTQCSSPVQARGGSVVFGWSTRFDAVDGGRLCTFRVYDKRGAQSVIRGDPLIGEAVLPLVDRATREGLVATFKLRRHRQTTGELTVHYELARRPEGEASLLSAGSILLGTAFGDDVVCAGSGTARKMMPCSTVAPAQEPEAVLKSRVLSAELLQARQPAEPEGRSPATSSTSLERGLARSESSGSFHSAVEEMPEDPTGRQASASSSSAAPRGQAADGALLQRRCEGVAETYMNARFENDVDVIRGVLASDAVVAVPTPPLGRLAVHSGWSEIESYFLSNPAKPGYHSDWVHCRTQGDGCSQTGAPETVVVCWTGKVYKAGFWHRLNANIAVDPGRLLIRRVDLARA